MTGVGEREQGGFTALVVEDEPLIALDTEEMLRDLGASTVDIVADYDGAEAKLGGCHYGIVLFDLNLDGRSTKALLSRYIELGCKAVVVSGEDAAAPELEGFDVPILAKPVRSTDLRSVLTEAGFRPNG